MKDFVPHEEALALKELGFDEDCLALYVPLKDNTVEFEVGLSNPNKKKSKLISAPTYSQAFRWFREKYNLKAYIIPIEYLDGTQETYQWNIFNECHSGVEQFMYEEAELACLRKLIEIVKSKYSNI